ncbi:MAG TPA: methyltetrahydrofolate cobalamin methyltransferase, partial [Desulfosalsimonadaceae bacterium]|nr:methyltetrahydrofolate cobalamin methyltransferase [Desulfosalsimonadaceae bacterium]
MQIVGELINSSRKPIKAAIDAEDSAEIKKIAKDQYEHGADFIDVNAGVYVGKESGYMQWLVKTVQEAVETPCCIDSPD